MLFSCTFYFQGSLNDFLPKGKKDQPIIYSAKTLATAKDAIEAIGVPHVEVKKLVVNTIETSINHLLQANEYIRVFPFEEAFPPAAPKALVLDVHLGKLARRLRLLGIDALYQNDFSDAEIVAIAVAENRAVLTRDIGLLKHKRLSFGYWLRSQQPEEQLQEVIKRFSLSAHFLPFTRCIRCNGKLQPVEKSAILDRLPEQTKISFDYFFQCNHCGHVYWKGSHYERMQAWVEKIRSVAC